MTTWSRKVYELFADPTSTALSKMALRLDDGAGTYAEVERIDESQSVLVPPKEASDTAVVAPDAYGGTDGDVTLLRVGAPFSTGLLSLTCANPTAATTGVYVTIYEAPDDTTTSATGLDALRTVVAEQLVAADGSTAEAFDLAGRELLIRVKQETATNGATFSYDVVAS